MEWIGIVIAGLAAIASCIIAFAADHRAKLAQRLAEKSNKLAQAGNGIASQALAQAAAANEFAEDANKLSQEANSLSGRALLHVTEESFVQWAPDWKSDEAVLVLVNHGRDRAFKPSVVVTADDVHAVGYGEETDPGDQIDIPLEQVAQKRAEVPPLRIGNLDARVSIPGRFKLTLNVVVLWNTENGFQREQRLEFEISEGGGKRRAIIL